MHLVDLPVCSQNSNQSNVFNARADCYFCVRPPSNDCSEKSIIFKWPVDLVQRLHSSPPPQPPTTCLPSLQQLWLFLHLSLRCTCTCLHLSHFQVWVPMCPLSQAFPSPNLDLQALPPHSLSLLGFIFSSTLSSLNVIFHFLVRSVSCVYSACRLGEPWCLDTGRQSCHRVTPVHIHRGMSEWVFLYIFLRKLNPLK